MMNDLSQRLAKGTLLVIETGEYSDRTTRDPIRLLVSATKQELADAYRAEWSKDTDGGGWRDEPDGDGFFAWLVRSGRAEDVANVHTWHVGSYGRFDPE